MPDRPISRRKAEGLAASALGKSMITMKDIAQILDVDYRTVQNWRERGYLPTPDFSLGGVLRWRRETVLKFINTRSGVPK